MRGWVWCAVPLLQKFRPPFMPAALVKAAGHTALVSVGYQLANALYWVVFIGLVLALVSVYFRLGGRAGGLGAVGIPIGLVVATLVGGSLTQAPRPPPLTLNPRSGPDLRFRTSEPLPEVPQEGIEPPTGGLEGRCSIP